jgi:hypothetical protein
MKNINPNIPPPNGYIFRDADGTELKGTSWASLERAVLMYRRQTGGKQTDLMEEILTQVCDAAPGFCRNPRTREQHEGEQRKDVRFIIISYLTRIARTAQDGNLTYAAAPVVDHRVKTCLSCPFRKNAEVGCQTCMSSIAALKKVAMRNKQIKAPALGMCDALEEDLSVATHINEQGACRADLPDTCWRKQK